MKIAPQVVYIRAWRLYDTPHSVSSWTSWTEYSSSWRGMSSFSTMNDDL